MRVGWLAVGLWGAACAKGTLGQGDHGAMDASPPAAATTTTPPPTTTPPAATPTTATPVASACTLRVGDNGRMQHAPAAPGQRYLRCGSVGSDVPWHMTMSPDGTHVAARTSLGTVRLIATDGWRQVSEIVSPVGRLDAVAFSPDGTRLAVMSAEAGEITLWDVRDGKLVLTRAAPPGPTIDRGASALAFSADGSQLATSLGTIVDLVGGASAQWTQAVRYRSSAPPYGLVANPQMLYDGIAVGELRFIAAGGTLFSQESYRIGNSPETVRLAAYDRNGARRVFYEAYQRDLYGYALSPDGTRLAIASYDYDSLGQQRVLRMLRTDTGELVGSTTFSGSVFAFSADGSRVLVNDTDVDVRDAASLASVSRFALPRLAELRAVAPNGTVVASSPGATFWLDVGSGRVIRQRVGATTEISWSADGGSAVRSGDIGALFHVSTPDGERDDCALAAPPSSPPWPAGFTPLPVAGVQSIPPTVGGHTIYGPAVSPDGALIAGTSIDASGGSTSFGVWRLVDGAALWLKPEQSAPAPPWFSTDAAVVISRLYALHTHASDHYAFHLWDVPTGELQRLFGADVHTLAVSPDGTTLATREGHGIALWCR
jgi:WD40 repeat protein